MFVTLPRKRETRGYPAYQQQQTIQSPDGTTPTVLSSLHFLTLTLSESLDVSNLPTPWDAVVKHGDISFSDSAPNHTIAFGTGQIWSGTTSLHSVQLTFETLDIYTVECIELVCSTLEVNVLNLLNHQNNDNDFQRMYTKRGTSNSRVTVKDLSLGFIPTDCFEFFIWTTVIFRLKVSTLETERNWSLSSSTTSHGCVRRAQSTDKSSAPSNNTLSRVPETATTTVSVPTERSSSLSANHSDKCV